MHTHVNACVDTSHHPHTRARAHTHTHTHTGNKPATGTRDPRWRQTMINGTRWRGEVPEATEDVFW